MDDTVSKFSYGVVQGRLVPQVGTFVQDFPTRDWLNELTIAGKIGCTHIEWILTADSLSDNPLLTMTPVDIAYIRNTFGVAIDSVCYDAILSQTPIDHEVKLKLLVDVCEKLRIGRIVIPLLENASVRLPTAYTRMLDIFRRVNIECAVKGVHLSFETDLDYFEVARFVKAVGAPPLGMHLAGHKAYVTLDTGNIARLGYDIVTHASYYGDLIDNVHIKDVSGVGGRSVPLGTGIVAPDALKRAIESLKITTLTFQTARINDVLDVDVFKRNAAYIDALYTDVDGGHNA